MKRCLIALLLLVMAVQPALAAEGGYRYEVTKLGLYVNLEEDWLDDVSARKLSLWVRTDEAVQAGGALGYALFYVIPDLTGYAPKTYEEGQAWLNENAVLLGGVLAHSDAKADLSGILPALQKTPLGEAGGTAFTLVRPESLDATALDPDLSALAEAVYAALLEEGRFAFYDATADYGYLGMLDAADLVSGDSLTNDWIASAKLTVVNFWGTFCNPCISELPTLEQLSQTYADRGVRFLGVVTDGYDEQTLSLGKEILASTGVSYPNIGPYVSSAALAGVQFTPTTVFLDGAGHLVGEAVVGGMALEDWEKAIEERLAMAS